MRLVINCLGVDARDVLDRASQILQSAGIVTKGGALGPHNQGVLLLASDVYGAAAVRILREQGIDATLE
jgi:hypothetical protein